MGCRAARTDAVTMSGSTPFQVRMRRNAWMRLPTISALGLSRSCGSVSHAGNSTISAFGSRLARAARSASDSRPVGVIAKSAADSPFSRRASTRLARSGARKPSVAEKSASRLA